MHYLITGHTGFKGAWLTLLLKQRGHTVSGIALDPLPGALFEIAELTQDLEGDVRLDIRDASGLRNAFQRLAPDVVVHMAAQPLVRESYRNPRYTFETNVDGTLNVLEATAATSSVKAQLIVTTDKVYRNVGKRDGYVETDALGGVDPYSASKAMADLLTQSWVASFPAVHTAIARAGNVIGGGDVSPERLLPDLISAFATTRPAVIRYPDAVRPWQHVLDCLNGYSLIIDAMLRGHGNGPWNIGPDRRDFVSVREVADEAARLWGHDASWTVDTGSHPHEAALLTLDSGRTRSELGWSDRAGFRKAAQWTVDWHRHVLAGKDPRTVTIAQIQGFESGSAAGA